MLNQSAIQRGLFCLTSYHTIDCCEKKRANYTYEEICLPPENSDRNIKDGEPGYFRRFNANYSLLDKNGIVRAKATKVVIRRDKNGVEHKEIRTVGSMYVKPGDVIIGKVVITGSKTGEETRTDASVIIQPGDEGYIDRIHTTITPNGYKLVNVVLRVIREPTLGDKVASRAAQKGTIGMVYNQEDMPFSSSGIVPDIIINPLCIPSRMTANQLIETVIGKKCAMDGVFGDATPFTELSTNRANKLMEELENYGFESHGWETMYNGMTGEMIQAKIFMGLTYYQRLKHMVDDKMHARAHGQMTTLTRQPLEGKITRQPLESNPRKIKLKNKIGAIKSSTVCKKNNSLLFPCQNLSRDTWYLVLAIFIVNEPNNTSKLSCLMVMSWLKSIN